MPEDTKHLTLTFVDVPNIVDVRETLGEDGARAFLKQSGDSLDAVRKVHGGALIRSVGSTMLIAFERVEDAVRAACEIQTITDLWDSSSPAPVFRIGVHCGPVTLRNGGVVGDAVSTSARLVTNAKPSQILCSATVAEQVPESLKMLLMGLAMDEVTAQRFNGRLYEIIWRSDGESAEPAAVAAGNRRQPAMIDIETVKTHTAPLAVNGHEEPRRKIRLTKMHRKDADEASCSQVATQQAVAHKEDTARLCLVWERHVVVVDGRKTAVTMGRSASNDITLDVETASRQHAHVEWRDGEFYLVDHSWNGTYLYDEDGFESVVHNDEAKLEGGGVICPGCPGNDPAVVAIRFIEAG